jgi:hypothetical protein
MRTVFVSIVLNEEGIVGANLAQHYDHCDEWIIVEGADVLYPKDLTKDGLSVDRTAEVVRDFPDPAGKITLIRHGICKNKQELRNRYCELIHDECVVVVFDADEFLCHGHLDFVLKHLRSMAGPGALRIPHVHFWKSDSQVIEGGYYNVPHDRLYRWLPGCRYVSDHNHPEVPGGVLLRKLRSYEKVRNYRHVGDRVTLDAPYFCHYGFCKPAWTVNAKNTYYLHRGEASSRPITTASRAAFFNETLTPDLTVHRWGGMIPEVYHENRPGWLGGGNWQRPDEPRPV